MVTCLLAIVVEKKVPSRQEVASLAILTMGVSIAVAQVWCAPPILLSPLAASWLPAYMGVPACLPASRPACRPACRPAP